MGLQGRIATLEVCFDQDYPEETPAEEVAWTALVKLYAGLSAFFSITDSEGKPIPGL